MTSRCCSGEKAVLVAVYAEMPRRSHPLSGGEGQGCHHHHHHYHHFHHYVSKIDGRVRGYNRRSQLLDYARHLRASTQSAAASASVPSHPSSHVKQVSTVQISTADRNRKRKHSSPPTCFDKWECLIPSSLRSTTALNNRKDKVKKNHKKGVSTTAKMKALVNSVHVQKKGSFLSQLLRKLKKRR